MSRYGNLNGGSGVYSYEIGSDRITITFSTNSIYEYTYESAGNNHIETMKSLAIKGKGLNGYINTYTKFKYSRKIS
ncbi:hypothetical protein [Flavivirga jejuensis]|uniref:KTSC domain-containing protein n=1 Tax=Flavivirga jejuensis TaxID=870487 RepID=A0ABT8WS57_9FLAO|nr:hypothetical protein [Flavivirga jejuensis]MDO5975702.1 hypothetical protein [Flavivirga jejuensis]